MVDEIEDDLKALGVTYDPADLPEKPPDSFEVFPENWNAVKVFLACSTQWRIGFGGRTGLDYNVIFPLFGLYGIKKKEQEAALDDIRVMEQAVLSAEEKKARRK